MTVAVDLQAFEEGLSPVNGASRRPALAGAVDAYGGDLLPDCNDEWILPERERLRNAYARLPRQVLAGMRGLRDANKYRLCYLLFTRQHPARLRDPAECEGLYEQFTRNILYLQPYQPDDARRVFQQLAVRRKVAPALRTEETIAGVLALSGCHPGLMVALVSGLSDEPPEDTGRLNAWAHGLAKVHEKCRRIYEGLPAEEQAALRSLVHGAAPGREALRTLQQKGLVRTDAGEAQVVFAPPFTSFLIAQSDAPQTGLYVDRQTGMVVVDGVAKPALGGLVHDLFVYLYERAGQVCKRDEIAEHLYGNTDNISNNRIDAVATRLRQELGPDPAAPRYLKTVRGRGYRLVLTPET